MISRSRSAPTAATMSIECTTSANKTVTCLYSADPVVFVTAAPHSLQNLAFGRSSVPHDPHDSPAAVSAPRASSTRISCHCWSTISVIPPCHLRYEVLPLTCRLFQDNVGGRPWMPGVTAFPLPTRYAPRSQAFSPCRGSDPGIRDSGHRHREPAPAELAAAAAILRG
jgi:hypothetical protein